MAKLTLKSENQILGDMARTVLAKSPLNDLNPGSVILTLLEAAAQEDFAQYYQILQAVRNTNLDTTTGSDLDNRAFEYGLVRRQPLASTGKITVLREAGFLKISSGFYIGFRSRLAGDTSIPVNDASEFPASGTLIIGRGTPNEEEVAYASAPINNTNYWTINLSAPLTNDHSLEESVILKQGVDITIPAGTIVQVPATSKSSAVAFTTTQNVVLLAGEDRVEDVDVTCTIPGIVGNISVNAINGTAAFPAPPFPGARALNESAFSSGRDRETDTKLRNRVRNFIQALTQSTKAGIANSIDGLVDPVTAKRVVSSNIILPDNVGLPVKIYIDDGTGFEPSFASRGEEVIVASAVGGEQRLQLDLFPLVKAQVETGNFEPYDLSSNGLTLLVEVGTESETITFFTNSFQIPEAATAEEVVAVINNSSTLLEARTSQTGKKVVITAKSDSNENIRITGGTANVANKLNFPTNEVFTFYLYKNDLLLSKDGQTAFVDAGATAPYDFSGPNRELKVVVDGKTANEQTVTIQESDFPSPAAAASASAAAVAAIINEQLAGATAVDNNGRVRIISNTELSSKSKIKINASDAATAMSMPLTEVVGSNQDYTLNPELGVIELTEPLATNDKLTAGSRNTRAFVTATIPEDYTFVGGENLIVTIDGGSPQVISLSAQTNSSADVLAAEINASLEGGTAVSRTYGSETFLEIRTNTFGPTGSVEIDSLGAANLVLQFPADIVVYNQNPHTSYVVAQASGPYAFVEGETLVVVLDNDPAGKTFVITMDYDGAVTSGSSTTAFAASGLTSVFATGDLIDYWVVMKSGDNTSSETVNRVTSPVAGTFRYFFDAPPANFEDFAVGDQVTFSDMENPINDGNFLITGIQVQGSVFADVLDSSIDNPTALTPVLGDRYLIPASASTALAADVVAVNVENPSALTPSAGQKWIIAPGANSVTLDSVRDLLTDSAAAMTVHGYRYIVNGVGVNDWVGQDHKIAQYNGVGSPGWLFITPVDGDVVLDLDSSNFYQFDSGLGQWVQNDWGGKAGRIAEWNGSTWLFSFATDNQARLATTPNQIYQYDQTSNTWTANDWGGSGNKIAEWDGSDWDYTTPANTDVVYSIAQDETYQYNGSAWVPFEFWVEIASLIGETETGSSGTGLLCQRRQIDSYNGISGAITVSSAFRAIPDPADALVVLPGTKENVAAFFSNTKVTSLSGRAVIELVEQATKVQISSRLSGSDGFVQVTGGRANEKLQFSTTQVQGLQAYSYYIGLIKLVHKTIYGDETDLVSFPGVGAAGVKFQILAPTVQEIPIQIDVTLQEGISISNVETEIKTQVIAYINNLGVAAPVILSQIVDRVLTVAGVIDAEVVSPTENVAIAQNELAITKASIISVT